MQAWDSGRTTLQGHQEEDMCDQAQTQEFSNLNAIDTIANSLCCRGALFVVLRRWVRAHRQGAEYLAWSTVHGMALLSIDGPLRVTRRRCWTPWAGACWTGGAGALNSGFNAF